MRVRAALAALLMVTVAGCTRASEPPAKSALAPSAAPSVASLAARLVGPKWFLTQWTQDGRAYVAPPKAAILFTPTAIDAFDGCNDIEGGATYLGSQVRFPPLMVSAVACGEGAIGRLDEASIAAFVDSVDVAVVGSTLTVSGHGVVLTYTRGGPVVSYPPDIGLQRDDQPAGFPGLEGQLVGPLWRLDSVAMGGSRVAATGQTRGYMNLGPASVSAGDGCTEYDSAVSYDGSVLTFSGQTSEASTCGSPAGYRRVGAAYQALLQGRVDARLADGTLTLTGDGVTLVFSKDPAA